MSGGNEYPLMPRSPGEGDAEAVKAFLRSLAEVMKEANAGG